MMAAPFMDVSLPGLPALRRLRRCYPTQHPPGDMTCDGRRRSYSHNSSMRTISSRSRLSEQGPVVERSTTARDPHWFWTVERTTMAGVGIACSTNATRLLGRTIDANQTSMAGRVRGLAIMLLPASYFVQAQGQPPVALTGKITSDAEGAM